MRMTLAGFQEHCHSRGACARLLHTMLVAEVCSDSKAVLCRLTPTPLQPSAGAPTSWRRRSITARLGAWRPFSPSAWS